MRTHEKLSQAPGLTAAQRQRAVGAVVAAATGDALGAPYEFQAPDVRVYKQTFKNKILMEKKNQNNFTSTQSREKPLTNMQRLTKITMQQSHLL